MGGKFKVSDEDKSTVVRLQALVEQAAEVIFASNNGSEAQALFAILCQAAKAGRRISRMWLTTLSNRAITYAYRNRESGRNITRIARSGFVHHGMNFLFRANVEQAFAQMYGKQSFPMERMDIAALWLLCNSYDNMKVKLPKKTRYGVGITGNWNGKSVQLAPAELWTKKSEAQSLYDKFMKLNGKTVMAEVVEVNPKVEWRHELLNMVTLQEVAIEELGFLPARTMAAADLLFEKGLISSPRTSVSSLPHHLKRHIERRFPEAKAFPFCPEEQIPYCHGIITTERTPLFLSDDEQRVYELINIRTEMAFDSARCIEVGIAANIEGVGLFGTAELPDDAECVTGNIEFTISGVSIYSFSEHSPETLTAATFLHDLNELVNTGGDTPSLLPVSSYRDCGACLQRLIDNGFVKYLLGDIEPTEKARVLLSHAGHLELADIGKYITQIDEADALAENRKPTKPVMRDYENWLHPLILSLITDKKSFASKVSGYTCPKCGNHGLTVFPATIACECCGFSIPRHFHGYDLTDKDIEQLVRYKYTSPIYGFIDRKGRKFCESLVIDNRFGVTFSAKAAKIYG
nr:DNA topoisomerase [Bacteroides acidifaciens]